MHLAGTRAWLRPAVEEDEDFLFEVFGTTWQHAVAAMPNPQLARHFLRIQYTAQNRRFDTRYPGHERLVVMRGDTPVGRLYLHRAEAVVHIVDLTILPDYRDQGVGGGILRDLMGEAARHRRTLTLRVSRRNARAVRLSEETGFRLVTMDDLDAYFEWTPPLRAV